MRNLKGLLKEALKKSSKKDSPKSKKIVKKERVNFEELPGHQRAALNALALSGGYLVNKHDLATRPTDMLSAKIFSDPDINQIEATSPRAKDTLNKLFTNAKKEGFTGQLVALPHNFEFLDDPLKRLHRSDAWYDPNINTAVVQMGHHPFIAAHELTHGVTPKNRVLKALRSMYLSPKASKVSKYSPHIAAALGVLPHDPDSAVSTYGPGAAALLLNAPQLVEEGRANLGAIRKLKALGLSGKDLGRKYALGSMLSYVNKPIAALGAGYGSRFLKNKLIDEIPPEEVAT